MLRPEPLSDIGFTVRSDGDLVCCNPIGTQMRSGCGMTRDANGDITFDGTDPTIGFLEVVGDDLAFRVI